MRYNAHVHKILGEIIRESIWMSEMVKFVLQIQVYEVFGTCMYPVCMMYVHISIIIN